MPLLYHLAQKCRTVQDKDGDRWTQVSCLVLLGVGRKPAKGSQNLYVLSELSEYILKTRAKLRGWLISSYPGNVNMPTDIFKALAVEKVKEVRWSICGC